MKYTYRNGEITMCGGRVFLEASEGLRGGARHYWQRAVLTDGGSGNLRVLVSEVEIASSASKGVVEFANVVHMQPSTDAPAKSRDLHTSVNRGNGE